MKQHYLIAFFLRKYRIIVYRYRLNLFQISQKMTFVFNCYPKSFFTISQPSHDVRTTLYGRCYGITLNDVVTTSFRRCVCRLGRVIITQIVFSFSDFIVPKEVPSSCVKYVKQYTDGEMTLPDYVKSLKICKQNEAIAKQIAKTSKSNRHIKMLECRRYDVEK